MTTCDLCGAEVSSEEYCHIAVMPNPTQPKSWFLVATDSSDNKERVSDSKPSARDIGTRLSQAFAKQTDVRETQASIGGPRNLPFAFAATSGKLYFCRDCVKANGGEMTKTGVAFVRGKAKKRGSKRWWPF